MKTLTVTAARQNLGTWLKRTLQGEDIGVMIDGAIVAFRPVKVYSEDYATHEYGATPEELDEFVQRANQELDEDRRARRLKPFTGKLKRG
jgi:antitoxin (DNA-binding transcriptional repressor) of toxin-antitoxin stability system